jgi:hypothetical protein
MTKTNRHSSACHYFQSVASHYYGRSSSICIKSTMQLSQLATNRFRYCYTTSIDFGGQQTWQSLSVVSALGNGMSRARRRSLEGSEPGTRLASIIVQLSEKLVFIDVDLRKSCAEIGSREIHTSPGLYVNPTPHISILEYPARS